MAAIILSSPSSLHLAGNLPPVVVEADAPFVFQLSRDGEVLVSEDYDPAPGTPVEIDIRDLVLQDLSVVLPDTDLYEQRTACRSYEIDVDGQKKAFTAVRAGVATNAVVAAEFLANNWLTWQPQVVAVAADHPAWLTFFVTDRECSVNVRFYGRDGSQQEVVIVEHTQIELHRVYSVNMQFTRIWALGSGERYGMFDVWIEGREGQQLTYTQRYVLDRTASGSVAVFENSLGGWDTVVLGERSAERSYRHSTVRRGDVRVDGGNPDDETVHRLSSGVLSTYSRRWIQELLRSPQCYVLDDGRLRPVVMTDSSASVSDVQDSSCDIAFVFSDDNGYLNIDRDTAVADVIELEGPDGDIFFLTPRLSEFQEAVIDASLLFPVQTPFLQEWRKLSVGALTSYLLAAADSRYLGMIHTHENKKVLDLLSEDGTGQLLYRGSAVGTSIKDYNDLQNRPGINGVVLAGMMTAADLGLVTPADLAGYLTREAAQLLYLGIDDTAADASKLGGRPASDYWHRGNANLATVSWTASEYRIGGNARLVWDSGNNAVKIVGPDGSSPVNLLVSGSVGAYGSLSGEGGGAGTMDYNELLNRPGINGVVLAGMMTASDLGLVAPSDLLGYATESWVQEQEFLTEHQSIYALTMTAGKFAAGVYNPKSSAKTVSIPTNTSHLINDSGFITAAAIPESYPLSSITGIDRTWIPLLGNPENVLKAVQIEGKTMSYAVSEGIVRLPAYPVVPSTYAWSAITGKPDTLAGYGITNAYTMWESDNRFLGKAETAADSSKLDGISGKDYTYATIVDYSEEGCVVRTHLSAAAALLIHVHIVGATYGYGKPIDSNLEFYNYPTDHRILQPALIHNGYNFGNLSIFVSEGVICLWLPYIKYFSGLGVFVKVLNREGNNYNRVTSITKGGIPSDASQLVSVTPKVSAMLTDNVSSATNADMLDGLHADSFFGAESLGYGAKTYDFNLYNERKYYYTTSDTPTGSNFVNAPFTESAGGFGVLSLPHSAYGSQIAVSYGQAANLYVRSKEYNGEPYWGDWYKVYHSGNSNMASVPWSASSLAIAGKTVLHNNLDKNLWLNYGGGASGENLNICGNNIHFYYGISSNYAIAATIASSGNIGIGIVNPLDKLHVEGNARADSFIIGTYAKLIWDSDNNAVKVVGIDGVTPVNLIVSGAAGAYQSLSGEGGGTGGTMDYNLLENLPLINGNVLKGNKTSAELGLLDLSSLNGYATESWVASRGYVTIDHAHKWGDITSGLPTTLAGYGITDAIVSTERQSSGTLEAGNWYRVVEFTSHTYQGVILSIRNSYFNFRPNPIILAITGTYAESQAGLDTIATITKYTGHANGTISKIRVISSKSGKVYVDVYVQSKNSYIFSITNESNAKLITPVLANDIPEGYYAYEYEFKNNGFETNRGVIAPSFVGNLTGNADTATDSDHLNGLPGDAYTYKSIVDYGEEGIVVKTNVSTTVSTLFHIHIIGSTYGKGKPVDSYLEFYNYSTDQRILQAALVHNGYNFGNVSVFFSGGVICIWIPYIKYFSGIGVFAREMNRPGLIFNRVSSIVKGGIPEDATSLVTVTPNVSAMLTDNVASATNAENLGGIPAANYWHSGNSNLLTVPWKARSIKLQAKSDTWNVGAGTGLVSLFSGATASPGAPYPYTSGFSMSDDTYGFQLAWYGGVSERIARLRWFDYTGNYSEWAVLHHSGNSNLPTIPWTASEFVIGTQAKFLWNSDNNAVMLVGPDGSSPVNLLVSGSVGAYGSLSGEGGGAGTTDYNQLLNRPSIDGKTLTDGMTSADLGLATLDNLTGYRKKSVKIDASEILQSDAYRMVTDTQIEFWNSAGQAADNHIKYIGVVTYGGLGPTTVMNIIGSATVSDITGGFQLHHGIASQVAICQCASNPRYGVEISQYTSLLNTFKPVYIGSGSSPSVEETFVVIIMS